MGKFLGCVIFLLTAPLTGTHPSTCTQCDSTCVLWPPTHPLWGYIILRCTLCPDFKNRERAASAAAVRSSAARGIEEENRHKTFCKCYGGKKQGGKQFCFYANPFGTINYLKKNAHQSVFMWIFRCPQGPLVWDAYLCWRPLCCRLQSWQCSTLKNNNDKFMMLQLGNFLLANCFCCVFFFF